ncbi:MAG: ABC transporter permease [Planctomycetes bacterium]|nr:ABC transporter permease [Planctomycetota bacterium]
MTDAALLLALLLLFALYLRRGAWVALLTFREALREVGYWLTLAIFAVLVLLLPVLALAATALGRDFEMVIEMAVDSIAFAGALFTLLLAATLSYRERRSRVLLLLLTRPVSRGSLLAGRLAGLLAAVLLAMLVLTLAATVAAGFAENNRRFDRFDLWPAGTSLLTFPAVYARFIALRLSPMYQGIALAAGQTLILAACVTAAAPRLSAAGTTAVGGVVFVVGHFAQSLADALLGRGTGAARAVAALLPNLEALDLGEMAGAGAPPGLVGAGLLYAFFYSTLAMTAGIVSFARHEPP